MKTKPKKNRPLKRRPVKPVLPVYNLNHPDLIGQVEFAFECGGKSFYRMANDFRLPTGRYKWIAGLLEEVEMRMNLETLKAYINELKKALSGVKGQIDLGMAFKIIYAIETRTNLGFEPETIKRLASVVYFDETEDLRDWDKKKGQEKIDFWMAHDFYGFFLTRPIEELLNLKGISVESLKNYISEATEILSELTSVLPMPSSENS